MPSLLTIGRGLRLKTPALEASSCLPAVDSDSDDLPGSFIRFSKLPSYPLDRLSRYEGRVWRQAIQIFFALQSLDTHPGHDAGLEDDDARMNEANGPVHRLDGQNAPLG
jgi:hypothetical protein